MSTVVLPIKRIHSLRAGIFAGLAILLSASLAHAAPVIRIEPLGDSITWGQGAPGGYRLPLYQLLTNAGFNVNFIGTQTDNGAAGLPYPNHEGYRGYRIDQIDALFLGVANTIADPDIILLLIGTNDYGQNYDTANAINRLDHLIGNIVTNRPNAKLIVCNILQRTDNPSLDNSIQSTFNPYVAQRVANHQALGQQVYFINMRAALGANDLNDGLHPNQTGYNKMGTNWFSVITNLFTPFGSTNAPAISHVVGDLNYTNAFVTFSKPVGPSATNIANYQLSGGLTISSASLDSVAQRVVTLRTSTQLPGHSYTLTVNNVHDQTPASLSIAPNSTFNFTSAILRGANNNVPESTNYTLVYSLDIPNTAAFENSGVPYTVDNHASVSTFSRIAYYLELQSAGGALQYAWVSMDAFASSAGKIGVPTTASGATYQRYITNMNVVCNVPGVINGTGMSGGYLEFWPISYLPNNSANVPGASSSTYDFGDQPNGGTYGSMQIHNVPAASTILAFNDWANGGGALLDLGIGSSSGSNPDWTFAANAASFTVKTLQVYVLSAPDNTPPTIVQASGGVGRTSATVSFSETVADSAANPAHYAIDGGVSVTGATLQPNLHDVVLTTTPQTAGVLYTVTVNGVADRSPNANLIAANSTASFVALQDVTANPMTYEDFNYNPNTTLDGDAGGTGWDANWGQFLGGAVNHTVVSGSLSDPTGTLLTSGNHVSSTVAGAYAGRYPFLPGYGTNTFYYSILMRYDATDGTTADDYFGLQLYASPANASSDLFIGKGGASSKIHLETGGNTGSGGTIAAQSNDSAITATVGQTYFLVVRVDFAAGAAANPDTFRLYVNPTPGGSEPAVADATLSYNLGVQNGLAVQAGNGAQVSFDEIRIGTNYFDVTPSNGIAIVHPILTVNPSGANVIVSWATNGSAAFNLYSRADVTSGTWTQVGPAPSIVGSKYQVSIAAGQNTQFFRLSNP